MNNEWSKKRKVGERRSAVRGKGVGGLVAPLVEHPILEGRKKTITLKRYDSLRRRREKRKRGEEGGKDLKVRKTETPYVEVTTPFS